MKKISFIFALTVQFVVQATAQTWQPFGSDDSTSPPVSINRGFLGGLVTLPDSSGFTISYLDQFYAGSSGTCLDTRLYIKRNTGSGWADIDTSFFYGCGIGAPISPLTYSRTGELYVSYYTGFYNVTRPTIHKFDGTNWTTVGPPVPIDTTVPIGQAAVAIKSIAFDQNNTPYVLVHGTTHDYWRPSVLKLSGNQWVYVGAPDISADGGYFFSMVFDHNNVPYIFFSDRGVAGKAAVMKFDGTNWVYVGLRGFSKKQAYFGDLAVDQDNQLYTVYFENETHKTSVMKFNGLEWVYISPSLNLGYSSMLLRESANGVAVPYLMYPDGMASYNVIRFDGNGGWQPVGNTAFSAGGTALPSGNLSLGQNKLYGLYKAHLTKLFARTYADTAAFVCIRSSHEGLFCKGTTVTFKAGAFNVPGSISYQWRNNSIPIPGATDDVYTTSTLANNDVIDCIAGPSSGLPQAASNTLTMTVDEPAAVITPANFTSCQGKSVKLVAAKAPAYLWSTGSASSSITVNQTGDYSLIIWSSHNCTDTTIAHVVVTSLPAVKIKGPSSESICDGNSKELMLDTIASIAGLSFQWKLDGSNIPGATTPTYTAHDPGNYTLVQSDTFGCVRTSPIKQIKTLPLPVANFTATGNTTFCEGGSVILQADIYPGYSYKWLRDGVSAGSKNNVKASLGGDYVVVAKLSICTDTSDPLTVTVQPAPPTAITTSDPTTFCSGSSALLQALPAGPLNTYLWTRDGDTLSETGNTHNALVKGTFKTLVTDENGCSKWSAGLKISVNPSPTATITPMGPTTIPSPGSVKLRASNSAGYTWQWFMDGNPIPGATLRDYIATAGGSYTVSITRGSCTSVSSAVDVTQSALKEIRGNTSAPDFNLSAYPNPVNDQLTIAVNGIEVVNASLYIVDMNGRLVATYQAYDHTTSISMGNLPVGVYFVRYKDAERTGTIKVVKQ